MKLLFVDTGVWFAFANRRDPDHAAVGTVLRGHRGRLVTTNFVFDEVVTLALARAGHQAGARVGALLREPALVQMVRVTPGDEESAWTLYLARPDKRYSFTDCTSFVVMRRLGIATAAALDEHFAQEGFEALP